MQIVRQGYLDLVRQYFAARQEPEPGSTVAVQERPRSDIRATEIPKECDDSESQRPLRLSEYRNGRMIRRCQGCAISLSVVAVGDLCGRCVLGNRSAGPGSLDPEAALRGRALAAVVRRNYPLLRLKEGVRFGPGLDAWAPALREMGAAQLSELLSHLGEAEA